MAEAEQDTLETTIERAIATMPVINRAEAEAVAWILTSTTVVATVAAVLRRDWDITPRPGTQAAADENMRRLVVADQYETVMPGGVPKLVPRNQCRCPILTVGDFCPVHGG